MIYVGRSKVGLWVARAHQAECTHFDRAAVALMSRMILQKLVAKRGNEQTVRVVMETNMPYCARFGLIPAHRFLLVVMHLSIDFIAMCIILGNEFDPNSEVKPQNQQPNEAIKVIIKISDRKYRRIRVSCGSLETLYLKAHASLINQTRYKRSIWKIRFRNIIDFSQNEKLKQQ